MCAQFMETTSQLSFKVSVAEGRFVWVEESNDRLLHAGPQQCRNAVIELESQTYPNNPSGYSIRSKVGAELKK